MRITRQQLLNLINEEISGELLRKENRRLFEAVGDYSGELYNMDVSELLDFAAAYRSLGAAVAEQLHDLLDEGEDADLNPNAVQMIREKLGGLNLEIDEALEVWETAHGGT